METSSGPRTKSVAAAVILERSNRANRRATLGQYPDHVESHRPATPPKAGHVELRSANDIVDLGARITSTVRPVRLGFLGLRTLFGTAARNP